LHLPSFVSLNGPAAGTSQLGLVLREPNPIGPIIDAIIQDSVVQLTPHLGIVCSFINFENNRKEKETPDLISCSQTPQ